MTKAELKCDYRILHCKVKDAAKNPYRYVRCECGALRLATNGTLQHMQAANTIGAIRENLVKAMQRDATSKRNESGKRYAICTGSNDD